jgi:2,3-bisphosphoglycerate-independent phosphoglycerate mutase
MKYVVLIPDGATDHPLDELDGQTPLQAARTPNLDALASKGIVGVAHTIPEGMPPGSDVGNLSVFGYDPRQYYTGRGPIEAASMGVPLNPRDVVYRCNLVSTDGEVLLDYSAGHISSEEGRVLIEHLAEEMGSRRFSFYPGVSYRHLLVWRDGTPEQRCVPPHDIVGKPFEPHLPEGDGEEVLRSLIWDSLEILDEHDINKRRRDEGLLPANMIWPWGQGFALSLPSFFLQHGVTGAVIAAVDLVRGIGKLAGFKVVDVPGATGYLDTNYRGKAEAALNSLEEVDLALIHVEAPDEAGHLGDIEAKIEAIERIDHLVVGTLREGLSKFEGGYRILVMPDHPTPIDCRTHCAEPVPFVIYDSTNERSGPSIPFDERALEESKLIVEDGWKVMGLLLRGGE